METKASLQAQAEQMRRDASRARRLALLMERIDQERALQFAQELEQKAATLDAQGSQKRSYQETQYED